MRVIVSCGGTGGHITPALAIADIIKENAPSAQILFVGATGGMEQELVARAGYEIRLLCVRGFTRKLTLKNLKTLSLAYAAVREAEKLLHAFLPDIVIGTGGYACYPTLRAAIAQGVPCAVHESNAVPGLAVKRLARGLDRVWLNFEAAAEGLPQGAKALVVGNPLPRGYVTPTPAPMPSGTRRMLLSFGGSLGARALNDAVLEVMQRVGEHPEIYHLHATGRREYERVSAEFSARGLGRFQNLSVVPFLSDMPRHMAAADLVICRAGAMSVSEVAALGRPCILIPSPNVTGNHQYKNAAALAARGAAVCLQESELDGVRLFEEITRLLYDEGRCREMSRALRQFHRSDVNKVIWTDICALSQRR